MSCEGELIDKADTDATNRNINAKETNTDKIFFVFMVIICCNFVITLVYKYFGFGVNRKFNEDLNKSEC